MIAVAFVLVLVILAVLAARDLQREGHLPPWDTIKTRLRYWNSGDE